MINAVIPKTKIISVFGCKNVVPIDVAPTDKPSKIVQMYNNAFEAVLTRFGTTPDSFIKFPNIKHPINGVHEGTRIQQPEESVEGDQYVVLLKKVSKIARSEETTYDVQFLTAHDNYEPNVVIEEVIVQETAKLPITYDSIALFVILGVIVILVIAVFMRIRNLSKKDEEK